MSGKQMKVKKREFMGKNYVMSSALQNKRNWFT